ELDDGTRGAVKAGNLIPVYFASGTRPAGIAALLNAIVELVPAPNEHAVFKGIVPGKKTDAERPASTDAPAAAHIFKTSMDQHAGRTSFARVISGTIKPDATMLNASTGNPERLGKIVNVVGKDAKQVDEAAAGDIVALAKLKSAQSGQTLSDEKQPFLF